ARPPWTSESTRHDHAPHADHVSLLTLREPCGSGHGNTQFPPFIRRSCPGPCLFQSVCHFLCSGHLALICSGDSRCGHWHCGGRARSIPHAITQFTQAWLPIVLEFSSAPSRSETNGFSAHSFLVRVSCDPSQSHHQHDFSFVFSRGPHLSVLWNAPHSIPIRDIWCGNGHSHFAN